MSIIVITLKELEYEQGSVLAWSTFVNTSLSIAFKTALILCASAVMKLKHLLTTYFTVLPMQTKEWPFWTKSKVLIVAF